MSNTGEITSHIRIHFLPAPAEDDNLETISLVDEIQSDFTVAMTALGLYTIELVSEHTRSGGIIVLAAKILKGIGAQKDLFIQLLKTSQPAIDNLTKQKHIQSIDINIEGKSLHIGNATEAQADWAMQIYEAAVLEHQSSPPQQIDLEVVITQDNPPAIAERTSNEVK